MKVSKIFLLILCCPIWVWAQSTLKTANQLIDSVNSAWPAIYSQATVARNSVNVLPATPANAKQSISQLQKSNKTTLGAVVYHTGGLLVDGGWIRILGAGSSAVKRNLPQWNKNKTMGKKFTLVADDAIGGYFMINDGELGTDTGAIYYLSPKTLDYKSLSFNYTQFLEFCFNGDLDKFYKGLRWKTWQEDVKNLGADNVFVFLPFLWRDNGKTMDQRMRSLIPAEEKYFLLLEEMRGQKN